jgi:uncharacterized membrane protein HdeD (DUF308 family)
MSTNLKRKVPIPIKLASVVWVLYGVTLAFGSILLAVLGDGGEKVRTLILAMMLGGIGIFFLYVGITTFRAKAGGTLGSGIVAIICGILLTTGSLGANEGINLLAGFSLLVSGVIFVAYRNGYSKSVNENLS